HLQGRSLLATGLVATMSATLVGFGLLVPATALAATGCHAAGDTGLDAAVVLRSGAHVRGLHVDATGCDIGIFIGPGSTGTTVTGSTVTGANDHGIFVENASRVTLAQNLVEGNGIHPTAGIAENKAIQLTGTSNSIVRGNRVMNNVADGGIGVSDNGPLDPAAPQGSKSLHRGSGNLIVDNVVEGNTTGCGIVVAAYNPGAGVWNNWVVGNTIGGQVGTGIVGGIVVAADPPATAAGGNRIIANTVTNSLIPGIIVHSNAPGDSVSDTLVAANRLSNDGWARTDGPAAKVAIIVAGPTFPAPVPQARISGTWVVGNQIASNQDIGVCFSLTATKSVVLGFGANHAATPVMHSADCFGSN
ncbi:MAG: right-handed parallel beta-helix repeat-containing protein, partial [Candidatus Limnocylindrales bacterium]